MTMQRIVAFMLIVITKDARTSPRHALRSSRTPRWPAGSDIPALRTAGAVAASKTFRWQALPAEFTDLKRSGSGRTELQQCCDAMEAPRLLHAYMHGRLVVQLR
jgi:hypothetical protein